MEEVKEQIDAKPNEKEEEENDFEVTIVASAHPKGEGEQYDGLKFRQNELEEQAKSILDQPMLYNHNDGTLVKSPIGKWTKGWVEDNGKGRLVLQGKIDGSTLYGARAIDEIRKGTMKGVSLGIDHLYSPKEKRILYKRIKECSVTKNPALEAPIIYVQPKSSKREIKEKAFDAIGALRKNRLLLEKQLRMMESTPQAPAVSQQEVATALTGAVDQNPPAKRKLEDSNDMQKTLQNLLDEVSKATEVSQEAEKKRLALEAQKTGTTAEPPAKRLASGETTPVYHSPLGYATDEFMKSLDNNENLRNYVKTEAFKKISNIEKNKPLIKQWFLNLQEKTGTDVKNVLDLLENLHKDPFIGEKWMNIFSAISTTASSAEGSIVQKEKEYQAMKRELEEKEKELKLFRDNIEKIKGTVQPPAPQPQKTEAPKPETKSAFDRMKEFGYKTPTQSDQKYYTQTSLFPPSYELYNSKAFHNAESLELISALFNEIGPLPSSSLEIEPTNNALESFLPKK